MKKRYIILFTTLIVILTISITYVLKQNKNIKTETKRLEQMINMKQEINKEYVYLFKITKQNIKEELNEEQTLIENQNNILNELKTKQEELVQENENIKEQIEDLEEELDEILEEQRKIEEQRMQEYQKRLAATTVKIENEITYSQFPEYPTGCEIISLKILLEYNGVYISAEDITNRLKKGELPYQIESEMYGGNPEIEFIGDPRTDYSYGVYNTPISEVANTFKEGVNNTEGLELDEILNIVSEKRPVMVWTTINNIPAAITQQWTYRSTGETIYWKDNEHAVVIIGFNEDQVIVSDPYTGRITRYNKEIFKRNYNFIGKRAVYY